MKRSLLLGVLICLVSLPAIAQDEAADTTTDADAVAATPTTEKKVEDKSFVYAPDGCDFEITFPEKPFNTRRCPEGSQQCYELTSYTMVFDLRTTVDISVSCNPSTPANYDRYTEEVIRAALEGMIARKEITEYNIGFKQYDTVRQATLTGSGNTGRQGKIYSAQIWAGPNSIFTVQAELVGGAHPQADAMFSEVLKSLKVKGEEKKAP